MLRLLGSDGYAVELGVLGYQFPDAADPQIRRSWLIVQGTATCPRGAWSFDWQALTPGEAQVLTKWLRTNADAPIGRQSSTTLRFTEPNLSFALFREDTQQIILEVGLDLEFSPPWRRQTRAGDPYVLPIRTTPSAMLDASAAWAAETDPFPP